MADFPVTESPVFSSTMEQITTQDRGHPDTFNPRYQTLLDNDNYLKEDLEKKHTRRTLTRRMECGIPVHPDGPDCRHYRGGQHQDHRGEYPGWCLAGSGEGVEKSSGVPDA